MMTDTDTLSSSLHLVDSVALSLRDVGNTARLGVLPLIGLLPLGAVIASSAVLFALRCDRQQLAALASGQNTPRNYVKNQRGSG